MAYGETIDEDTAGECQHWKMGRYKQCIEEMKEAISRFQADCPYGTVMTKEQEDELEETLHEMVGEILSEEFRRVDTRLSEGGYGDRQYEPESKLKRRRDAWQRILEAAAEGRPTC